MLAAVGVQSSRVQVADHDITVQVTKAITPPPLIDFQVTRWRIYEVEMSERGHSRKLGSIVDSSHGGLIGDRPVKPLLKISGASHVFRVP